MGPRGKWRGEGGRGGEPAFRSCLFVFQTGGFFESTAESPKSFKEPDTRDRSRPPQILILWVWGVAWESECLKAPR